MSGNFSAPAFVWPHGFCHFRNLIQRLETCPTKKQVTKKTMEVQQFGNYTPRETNFGLGIPLQNSISYNLCFGIYLPDTFWVKCAWTPSQAGLKRFHRSGVSKTYGWHSNNWKANFKKTGTTNTPSKHSRFTTWTGTQKINLTLFQTQPQCNTRNDPHN